MANWEFRNVRKDGTVLWVKEAVRALRRTDGKLVVLVVCEDITERKEAEVALQESQRKYRELVENISEVIFALDSEGTLTYLSPAVEAVSGYRPMEVVGRPFSVFVHPDDLPGLMESFQRTLAGQVESSEFRILSKTGDVPWVWSSSRPILAEDRVVGLHGVLVDITERRRAETVQATLHAISEAAHGVRNMAELFERIHVCVGALTPAHNFYIAL